MEGPSVHTPRVGSRFTGFIKTTLMGGFLVMVPSAVLIFIGIILVKPVVKAVKPLADLSPVQNVGGIGVATILAILVVLAASFLLGLLIQTSAGQASSRWFEEKLGKYLPGYSFIKRLSYQLAGRGDDKLGVPVLVRLDDGRQFGFLIEEHASGEATVFIPQTPTVAAGNVLIVDGAQIEKLHVSTTKMAHCITRYGVGSSNLILKGIKGKGAPTA